jgi:hypothetical protein
VYNPNRISLFESEVESLLGIDIIFSIIVNTENLGKAVDLIEGVELFIPSPVDEYQDMHIQFPSGVNYLDGDKVRVYITYELPEESDELANFRRQRVFMGLIKRLGEQNRFLKNPQAARVFHSLLKTGTNQGVQTRLFDEFAGIDIDRVSIQSISGTVREISGQALIFPHWDGSLIKEIVRKTAASLIQPAESVLGDRIFTVEVLNGTEVSGLAGRTAELLRGFGYDIVKIDNADRNDYEKTIIINRSGVEDIARAFGDVIRCSNIHFDYPETAETEFDIALQNFEYHSDLTLIVGKDFNGRYVTE